MVSCQWVITASWTLPLVGRSPPAARGSNATVLIAAVAGGSIASPRQALLPDRNRRNDFVLQRGLPRCPVPTPGRVPFLNGIRFSGKASLVILRNGKAGAVRCSLTTLNYGERIIHPALPTLNSRAPSSSTRSRHAETGTALPRADSVGQRQRSIA